MGGYNGHRIASEAVGDVRFRYKVGSKVLFSHKCQLVEMVSAGDGIFCRHRAAAHGGMVQVQKGMRGIIIGVHAHDTIVPVVRLVGDRWDGKLVLLQPVRISEECDYRTPTGRLVAAKLHVDLVPVFYGWAVTCHYMRGRTLRCKVVFDLGSTWEFVMAYVGCSRVTTWENLRLTGSERGLDAEWYNSLRFQAAPSVEEFYDAVAAQLMGSGHFGAYAVPAVPFVDLSGASQEGELTLDRLHSHQEV
jgi:hypothetical protein